MSASQGNFVALSAQVFKSLVDVVFQIIVLKMVCETSNCGRTKKNILFEGLKVGPRSETKFLSTRSRSIATSVNLYRNSRLSSKVPYPPMFFTSSLGLLTLRVQFLLIYYFKPILLSILCKMCVDNSVNTVRSVCSCSVSMSIMIFGLQKLTISQKYY